MEIFLEPYLQKQTRKNDLKVWNCTCNTHVQMYEQYIHLCVSNTDKIMGIEI
jgi:hypothetical protein